MIPGIRRLCAAVDLIHSVEDASLLHGASEIWSAMIDLPAWPEPLQDAGTELQRSMLRYGTIRMTIDHMSESEREQLRRDLVSFCELASQVDGEDVASAKNRASSSARQ